MSILSLGLVRLIDSSGTGQPFKWRITDKIWINEIHYYIFHSIVLIFMFQWICLMLRLITNAESSVPLILSSARDKWELKIQKLLGNFTTNFRVTLAFLGTLQHPRTKSDSSAKDSHRALLFPPLYFVCGKLWYRGRHWYMLTVLIFQLILMK